MLQIQYCLLLVVFALLGKQSEGDKNYNVSRSNDDKGSLTIMQKLKRTRSLEEFMKLVQHNGQAVTIEDIYGPQNDTERQLISGGLVLARNDECSPRPTTVPIPREKNDPTVIFWPQCTMIDRCGGCCPSEMLECIPSRVEMVELHVLKAKIPYPGAMLLDWEGPVPVMLAKDIDCTVICKLTPDMCKSFQYFNKDDCRCECNELKFCPPYKYWDEKSCECQCLIVDDCDNFNHESCRCDLAQRKLSSLDGNITAEQIAAYERQNNITRSNEEDSTTTDEPSTTSTTTTTTTSTTTTTTTQAPTTTTPKKVSDPCKLIWCPPFFSKRLNEKNKCVCTPGGGK